MTDSAPANPASYRWRIVILLMIYAALGHFNRVGASVAGTEVFIGEMGISKTEMGWVYTALLIFYTAAMLPGGWLIDRIGAGRALTLFGVVMGTFVILTGVLGWVTSTVHQLWVGLLVIRSIVGIGNSPLHPGAAHAVSQVTPESGRATANGMITAGAVIGVASCYPVFGAIMDALNWKWAFIFSGAALIAFGLFWARFAAPLLPAQHAPAPIESPSAEAFLIEPAAPGPSVWKLAMQGNLLLLTLSYAAYGYFQYLFFYWMEYYFEKVLEIPTVESRQATAYTILAMGAGMAVGGYATDVACRFFGLTSGRRGIILVGMGFAALFGIVAVMFETKFEVALFMSLSMGALGMCEGVFWTTATDLGGRARGFAGAFMNTGGNIGGLISPVFTPWLAARIGWPGSIAFACAVSAIGGAIWFAIHLPSEHETAPGDDLSGMRSEI